MYQQSFQPVVPSAQDVQVFPGAWRKDAVRPEARGLHDTLRDLFQARPIAEAEILPQEKTQRAGLLYWLSEAYPWTTYKHYCFVDATLRKPDGRIVLGVNLVPEQQKSLVWTVPNLTRSLHPTLANIFDADSTEQFSSPAQLVLWNEESPVGGFVPKVAVQLSRQAARDALEKAREGVLDYSLFARKITFRDGTMAPRPAYSEVLCGLLEEMATRRDKTLEECNLYGAGESPTILMALESPPGLLVDNELPLVDRPLRCIDTYMTQQDDFGLPACRYLKSTIHDPLERLGRGKLFEVMPYGNLRLP